MLNLQSKEIIKFIRTQKEIFMNKLIICLCRLTLTLIVCSVFNSCSDSYGKLGEGELVATGDAVDIRFSSVKILCSADLNVLLGKNYTLGVVYQELSHKEEVTKSSSELTYENGKHKTIENLVGNKFEVVLDDLYPSTKYLYRSFVKAGDKYYYGNVEYFNTKDIKRYVSANTGTADNVGAIYATIFYNLDFDDAEAKLLRYDSGILIGNVDNDEDLVIENVWGNDNITFENGENDTKVYTDGLLDKTEYRYRAVCCFENGIKIYGKIKKFKTLDVKDYIKIETGEIGKQKGVEAQLKYTINISDDNIRKFILNWGITPTGIIYSTTASTSDKLQLNKENVLRANAKSIDEQSIYLSDLEPLRTYYYRAFFKCGDDTIYGQPKSFETQQIEDYARTSVDLGLSIKWAACNVGAHKPYEYGKYYAWGETKNKHEYTTNNCRWFADNDSDLKLYGIINSKGMLTSEADAACVNWGAKWRIPTKAEFKELIEKCQWESSTQNNISGCKVTGPNGKSIFFPFAGHCSDNNHVGEGFQGFYWSSNTQSIRYEGEYINLSSCLLFRSAMKRIDEWSRSEGFTIRPVCEY